MSIPQPLTRIFPVEVEILRNFAFSNLMLDSNITSELGKAAEHLGYPVFVRSDISSFKQRWESSCFIKDESALLSNIREVIRYSFLIRDGIFAPSAIVFREYVVLESYFRCYSTGFPVSKEIRFFIKDRAVCCAHPYWNKELIVNPDTKNWKGLLRNACNLSKEDVLETLGLANRLAWAFPKSYLSIDFAKTKSEKWILIDVGPGELSYHQQPCYNGQLLAPH